MADWTDLIGPALGAAGSIYTSNKAANAISSAGNAAAQASQFRPIGVTTRFGKSGFEYDPASGQLTGAGYQAAPDVAATREGLMGLAGGSLAQAQQAQGQQAGITQAGQGLFNLGQSYVGQNPQDVAQKYMSQQQQLLAPGREQQLAQLTNQQQQQGRLGLSVGGTSSGYTAGAQGLQATNPQMAAYYNAMAQQDAQLGANAQTFGNQQVQFGQGLMTGGIGLQGAGYGLQNAALSPYTNYMQGATNIENQAQNALTQGAALGSSITAGSTNAARIQNAAANEVAGLNMQRNNAVIGGLTDPISQLIGGLSGSGGGGGNAAAVTNPYFQPSAGSPSAADAAAVTNPYFAPIAAAGAASLFSQPSAPAPQAPAPAPAAPAYTPPQAYYAPPEPAPPAAPAYTPPPQAYYAPPEPVQMAAPAYQQPTYQEPMAYQQPPFAAMFQTEQMPFQQQGDMGMQAMQQQPPSLFNDYLEAFQFMQER